MSVYFSKYCVNGYRDDVVRADPAMRERLLQAIKELSLLGPGHTLNLSTRVQQENKSARDDSRPGTTTDRKQVRRCQTSSPQVSRATSSQTPHGILKEKLKRTLTPKLEKGDVKVYASVLHPDVGFKTLSVTYQTTSQELVSSILNHYNAHAKDPNLYYVAMETGIKNKDSGLPISKMIVLDDDARPLELQACQPQGETKFHLKMKSGGLVRVRTNVLSPESTYKTVFIARCTTTRELIKLVINRCKTDELLDNFKLREASADFNVDRILQEDEYPLEVQSRWKTDEGRLFFLTRVNKEVNTNPGQNTPDSTSEELKNELAKQNQTIDTLNETIQRLQHEREPLRESVMSSLITLSPADYSEMDVKDDYDQIDDIDDMTQTYCNHTPDHHDRGAAEDDNIHLEKLRQRRASLNALDLHNTFSEQETAEGSEEGTTSQIDKLRHSFYQFKNKSLDDIDLIRKDAENDNGKPKERRRSQIEIFRHKFIQYHNVKTVKQKRALRRAEPYIPVAARPWSASDADADYIPHLREMEKGFSRKSSANSLCDQEIRQVFENSTVSERNGSPHTGYRTLFDVINNMELVGVTLKREPDEGLGLELAHVTQTGSPIENNPADVVYVYHKRDGETAIFDNPTRDLTEDGSSSSQKIDYENEVDDVFAQSSEIHDDNHTCFGSQRENSSAKGTPTTSLESIGENLCPSNEGTEPGSPRSCCALAEWRDGPGPKPRHGVQIVGITKGSIAEKSGELEKDDVIVEINGTNVLNSTLNVVIATLREQGAVHLVVAREKEIPGVQGDTPSLGSSLGSSPVPSHHEDMRALTEQVQQFVTKVTELQESLTKKDKTIAHLKKSLMKRKLKISSKEKIVEAVQAIV